MRRQVFTIMVGAFLWWGVAPALGAAWPSRIAIAGIEITGVQGSARADGSGTAVGTLQLAGNPKMQLDRSASGEVKGTCGISFATAGVAVQGSFTLDASGLKGKGSIHARPKDVTDASIVFDASGQATGTGRVGIGSVTIPANFSISAGSFDVSGSASAKARADTPLASYEFTGEVRLGANGGRITATAQGTVTRTGKLAQQKSTRRVSDVPVDLDKASATVNVDGVNVTFDLS